MCIIGHRFRLKKEKDEEKIPKLEEEDDSDPKPIDDDLKTKHDKETVKNPIIGTTQGKKAVENTNRKEKKLTVYKTTI